MYGSLAAVLVVNAVILAYAVSVSEPAETIVIEQSNQRAGAPDAADSAGDSGAGGSDSADDTDDEFYDEDDFDDWDDELPDVVNPIELPDDATIARLFETQCSYCHGAGGRGDGPAAEYLLPRPRDLVASPFRYATLGGDSNQITMDLERTVEQGVPGSGMPAFGGVLSDLEIAGVAHHVLALREESEEAEEMYEEPLVAIGMRPPWTPKLVAHGRELFSALACNTCHGDTGRGDGENAAALVDMQEKPVRPADLTSGLFKTGQRPDDLVRTIMMGVPGTPMVAYEMAVTQENDDGTVNVMDAWALVAYIRSLAVTPQPPGRTSGAQILVHVAPDLAMLSDPSHIAWLGIEPTLVAVKPLYQREEHTTHVEVRAVRFDDQLALCLDWLDETIDLQGGDGLYPDAIAAMLGKVGALGADGPVPPLPLGLDVPVPDGLPPVLVWHWSADAHFRAQEGRDPTAADADAARARGWRLLTATDESAGAHPIDAQVARGIGLPKRIENRTQEVTASAAWSRTMWRTIIIAVLETEDHPDHPDPDLHLEFERVHPISFAIWDGTKGEKNLLSAWHWLVWEE